MNREDFCATFDLIMSRWSTSAAAALEIALSTRAWVWPCAQNSDSSSEARGAAGIASRPCLIARVTNPLSWSRGNACTICGSASAVRRAMPRAVAGFDSRRAIQPAISISRIFAVRTAGDRKLLETKRPSAPPMRSLLFGTIAVWGIGRPSG